MKNGNQTTFFVIVSVMVVLIGAYVLSSRTPEKPEETPIWTIISPPEDITTMVRQGETIWVGGKAGVIGVNRITYELVELECEQRMTYTRNMILVDDTLWIGHDRGLTRVDNEGWYTYTEEDGMVEDRVNYVMQLSSDKRWAGTWHGAYYLEDDIWNTIRKEDGLIDNNVHVMLEDSYGGLWFGSYVAPLGGISIYSDGEWQYFSTENGLIHNNIVQLFLDDDGSVWAAIGLMNVGAAVQFKKNNDRWEITQTLTEQDGLPPGKIRSVYRDADGLLWIGSEDNGVAVVSGDKVTVLTVNEGLSHNEVKTYLIDGLGNIWLGTRNGITILSEDERSKFK